MDIKAEPVIIFIVHFERTERHVGYYGIERIVGKVCLFKALYSYLCFRIQKFCDTACNRIDLYSVSFFCIECFRQQSYKISYTQSGFENFAAYKAHSF